MRAPGALFLTGAALLIVIALISFQRLFGQFDYYYNLRSWDYLSGGAELLARSGHLAQASSMLSGALVNALRLPHSVPYAQIVENQCGDLALRRRDYDAAMQYYDRAGKALQKVSGAANTFNSAQRKVIAYQLMYSLNRQARIFGLQDEALQAESCFTDALKVSREIDSSMPDLVNRAPFVEEKMQALRGLLGLSIGAGNKKQALSYFGEAEKLERTHTFSSAVQSDLTTKTALLRGLLGERGLTGSLSLLSKDPAEMTLQLKQLADCPVRSQGDNLAIASSVISLAKSQPVVRSKSLLISIAHSSVPEAIPLSKQVIDLALLLQSAGQTQTAIDMMRRCAESVQNQSSDHSFRSTEAELLFALGCMELPMNQFKAASDNLGRALKLYRQYMVPGSERLRFAEVALTSANLGAGKLNESKSWLTELDKSSATKDRLQLLEQVTRAHILLREKKIDEARAVYQQVLDSEQGDILDLRLEACRYLMVIAAQAGDQQTSASLLARARTLAGKTERPLIQLRLAIPVKVHGVLLFRKGQYKQSRVLLEEALKILLKVTDDDLPKNQLPIRHGELHHVYAWLGEVYERLNMPSQSREAVRKSALWSARGAPQ